MEWDKITLDKLGSVSRGRSKHRPRNDESLFNGIYPFIQTGDVKRSGLHIVDYSETYNEKGLAQSKLWAPGTLCITIAANIADTSILSFPACFPDSIIGFVADKEKSDVRFIKYSFDILQKKCQAISLGATQDNLSWEKLSKIKFDIPSLSIQRRIASILSVYDNLIENNNRRIRLLEQMAENLYKEWFVRFRFPGHEKAEFENGLPKGWRVVTIKDICNVTDGVHNTIQDTPQSKYYLLSCKNIKDGKLVIGENERTIDEETFLKLRKRTQLAKGDILVSSVGTIGETILLNEDPTFFEFQRSVAMIKPDKRYVNSNFMYEMLKYMRKDLVNAAHGVAQQCLFLGDINKMRVFLPAMHTIAAFDEKVQPIYDQILSLSKQLNLLSRQRDLLLPRLMSGKLEVKV
jgi:type I restriction enzyme S subunit